MIFWKYVVTIRAVFRGLSGLLPNYSVSLVEKLVFKVYAKLGQSSQIFDDLLIQREYELTLIRVD
jgi:hypothetical protein